MKLNITALLLLLSAMPTATHAESLGRVYELALENDYQFQRAIATYHADLELPTIARSELLPKITADYLLRSVNEDSTTRQLITTGNGGLLETDMGLERDTDDRGWIARLDQPLFDAPAWYGYQQGKSKALAAESIFANAGQELLLRVVSAYLDVLRAQDNLAAARAQERAFGQQLEQTRKRFETGLIPVTDVAESQSAFDLAVVRTIEESNQVEVALEALSNLTGETHSVINILREDFLATGPEPDNVTAWAEAAAGDNLLLLAARHTEAAAQDKRKAASWAHAPKLTLGVFAANLDTSGTLDSNIESPFVLSPDQDSDTLGLELRLEIPLYEGGATSANRRRAEHQYQASRDLVSETQRAVMTQARQLFLKVKSDLSRIEARRQAILSAKAAFDAAEAGYNIGTRNIIDVLSAQNTLFSAERDYANSRYDYIENSFRLRATGARLRPGDLYRLDAFLQPPSNQQSNQRSVR
ncbi:MAG: TolC family outer membrane protein [Halieaceae bacterium]|uniref:TolC family outer membrane protein n=1 Tax=Haliea alexandrii TaxID=2448162 RepID=UPI000F0BD3AA|nr:TolC family outer membrane protein [Haliea alexandrii]MCR9186536.1 TolC family outer membrane protein [Halieaceae bacterium]